MTVFTFDTFWHLQMGKDWLENGLSPWIDHYSFTFHGKEISNIPYIFQVLLGWFVTQFGLELGFEVFKIFGFLLAFTLVLLFLRKLNSPTIIFLAMLTSSFFIYTNIQNITRNNTVYEINSSIWSFRNPHAFGINIDDFKSGFDTINFFSWHDVKV